MADDVAHDGAVHLPILVTGASGNIGRNVVDHLLARGATDVRALSTRPERANLPEQVRVHRGFLGDLDSLTGVFDGVARMYLAPYEDTAEQVCALAARAGVKHIVDLSGPADSWWGGVRRAVADSGTGFTHLEPGEFVENCLIWAEQIRTTGQVRDAFGDCANAPITMDDIAEVAAAILLSGDADAVDPRYAGTGVEMAGPELLTKAEKVAAIGRGLGRDVPFTEISRSEAIALLEPQMGEYAEWYVGTAAETYDPGPAAMEVVPRITGRPATTMTQWVRANPGEFT